VDKGPPISSAFCTSGPQTQPALAIRVARPEMRRRFDMVAVSSPSKARAACASSRAWSASGA
jgi:hypothetical protein